MSNRKRIIRGFRIPMSAPVLAQWNDGGDGKGVVQQISDKIRELGASVENRNAKTDAAVENVVREVNAMQAALTAFRVGGAGLDPREDEASKAFNQFARKGIQAAAMSTDSNPDGGYLVPETLENTIAEVARTYSPMRQLAAIKQLGQGSGNYRKVVRISGATAEWRGEHDTPSDTDHGQYSELEFAEGELTAQPRVSQHLLDDAAFDVEEELGGDVARSFAVYEGAAFVNGNGVKKPRGFLQYTTVANASWAWGKLGFIVTGDANGFLAASASVSGADKLIDIIYATNPAYRLNASWVMSSSTAAIIRKWKDQEGQFIWTTALTAGDPDMLLGYPVYVDDNMPSVAAGNFPIAFGDFNRGYLIVDRIGVRVLRDPYTAKPYVKFYTTKRVAGGVQDFAAIKLLKVST